MSRNLCQDLYKIEHLLQQDVEFAFECYRALCNNEWIHESGNEYMCTFRFAAQTIASIRNKEEE